MKKSIFNIYSIQNEFQQNTYVITIKNYCIIFDAGCQINEIKQVINNNKVIAIFITHCHFDHILHIEDYEKEFDCPIYLHQNGIKFLKTPNKNASSIFSIPKTFSIRNYVSLSLNQEIKVYDLIIKSIYTPGHTNDSISYLVNNSNDTEELPVLFTGDTIFAREIGRTDLATGNNKQLLNSLTKIERINCDYIYPGHGRITNKEEQLSNIQIWKYYLRKKTSI